MAGEKVSMAEAKAKGADQGRQRSTIGFPYMDLKAATQLAEAIHGNVGLGDCDDDQLAAWTNQSSKSSGFRVQIGAARMFDLITAEGSGHHKLTELGRAIVDPAREREAKRDAFLRVPLYRAIFDKYKGGVLPPNPAALEREIVSLGVGEKVKDRARQAFERSAEQANFFEHGKNRLVMPAVVSGRDEPDQKPDSDEREERAGGGGGGSKDPLIAALIKKLPESGKEWTADERVTWLQMISMAFQMSYGAVETIEIKKQQ